jgi:hypothetical protein
MEKFGLSPNKSGNADRDEADSSKGMHPLNRQTFSEFLPNPNCWGISQHHPQSGANRY